MVFAGNQFAVASGFVGKVHAEFVDAVLRANKSVPAPKRRRQRQRADGFGLQGIQLRKLLNAQKRDVMRINSAGNVDERRSETGAVPRVMLYLHAPSKHCGQEKERSENEHSAQNDAPGNRRARTLTNSGNEKWRREERQPHPNGAAFLFFRMDIDPS